MEYKMSNKKIALYWRFGAFYDINFEDGTSAFVTIVKSEGGREYCIVWREYNKKGERTYYSPDQGKYVSFLMSDDEARKGA